MISMLADASTRFGVNPKEAERFIKFLVVGAIGFVVDFGVFNLLINPVSAWLLPGHWLYEWLTSLGFSVFFVEHLAPTLAGAVSFVAAVSSNFMWNRYWTYPDSRSKSRRRQFTMFLTVSVVGFLIRLPLITFLNPIFKTVVEAIPLLEPYSTRIAANMALGVAVVVVLFWNFFANRYWTYNDVE